MHIKFVSRFLSRYIRNVFIDYINAVYFYHQTTVYVSVYNFLFSTRGFSRNCLVHKLWRDLLTVTNSGDIAATSVSFVPTAEGS